MRINFFFLAFLIPLSSLGQRVIKNEATNRHLHTDGTNIYLIPPTGFIPSTKHKGFGHTESNATIIVHVIELPLEVVHRQTSKKELAGQGWDWISEEKISVNGLNGYLIKASQQNFKGKNFNWTLIFEYEVYTNVVQCIFSDGTHSLNQDLERALASVVFKPFAELAIRPLELQFEKYGFFFWNVINGINLYRATGRGGIELTFTSDHFLIKKRTTELELIFYNKMKQMPFPSVTLTDMEWKQLNWMTFQGCRRY